MNFPVLVEFQRFHARVRETIRDDDRPVRQKREILRLAEVLVVFARNATLAERQHELLAVVRELVNLIQAVVEDPHVTFGIAYGI